jgi:hypothetical protein
VDVPKWSTQVVFAAGAVCVGWIAKDALGEIASSSAEQPARSVSEARSDELTEALSALASRQAHPAPVPVELTIVVGEGGAPAVDMAPGQGQPPVAGLPGGVGGSAGGVHGSSSELDGSRQLDEAPTGFLDRYGSTPRAAERGTAPRAAPMGTGGQPFWETLLHLPADPRAASGRVLGLPPAQPANVSGAPPSSEVRGHLSAGEFSLYLSPETATTAVGEDIVIAYDDSIVLVGDDGRLTGNTGDAGQGGVVALYAQRSAFTTSPEAAGHGALPQGTAGTLVTGGPGSTPQAGAATVAGEGTMTALSAGMEGGDAPNTAQGVVSPLTTPIASFSEGRAVDIAGYEDHSLSARGERNLVTYDDSNVFVDRDGQINANTGDLDSAGLNAVNTVRSNVSAGPHCDDGCDDESIVQAEAGVFDEGDVAIDGAGNVQWAPDGGDGDSDADEGDDTLPEDNGDDDDAEDDESPDGDVSDPVEPAETREEADSTREAADSGVDPAQNPPGDSVVIGGDGYDDLGIRVDGSDNTMTYDDSNVVLGGTGDVNAQIGDADTGGVAVMNTVDSEAHGGNSR